MQPIGKWNMKNAAKLSSRRGARPKNNHVLGWNYHVRESHQAARYHYNCWALMGKPSSGETYNNMLESRKIFKNKLKWCQNNEDKIRMDILAAHQVGKNFTQFWKATKNLNYKTNIPASVNGEHEPTLIAELFSHHFKVTPNCNALRQSVIPESKSAKTNTICFTPNDVASVVRSMKRDKSPGCDGLSIEHIVNAGPELYRVLADLYTCCVNTGYLPINLMKTVVVSVPKNKTGDLSSLNNYRPISLGTVLGKVLERLIFPELKRKIKLSDAQFGFRSGLSTDSAIFSLKSTAYHYVNRGTSVYACFLDLSRAFDMVNYNLLWQKLTRAGVSTEIVNLLRHWYENQNNYVRWGDATSSEYRLECGVRQGGLTSPDLFSLYMNDLIDELRSTKVGCYIGNTCMNNFSYADDMVLLSPSIKGLRRLIDICERYAISHGLKYNVKKTQLLVFKEGKGPDKVPPVFLDGASVERVDSFKYLGHVLKENLRDDDDIVRERRALAVRGNMLARRFYRSSDAVKQTLFRAYCQSFYTCHLWTSTALILLIHLSLHTVDKGYAINPSCTCIRFTSTHGKERGTFSSPDYPRPYPRSTCLLYTFMAEPHQIVELMFTDFDIYKEHLDCIRGDYLKVYSEGGIHGPGPPGINEYSAWSRVICGSRADAPPALYSPGPLLVLELNSGDKASNASGFIGTYRFIDRRNFETDGVQIPDTGCDYVFNSQPNKPAHGRLYSPRYPSSYPSNVRCNYHFHARKNERIKIIFEESFLQKGDESCLNRADIIKVFDGKAATSPVLAMLCNEIIGYEILSTGPDLLAQFTANSNAPGQGFKASYQFLMDDNTSAEVDTKKTSAPEAGNALGPAVSAATSSCHQVFTSDKATTGKLISPMYPSPYPQKTQCHYDFLARGRQRVRLVFEDFSLQKITGDIIDCESMDSLDIFLYVDGRLEKMASYCGSDIPKPIMSNGPKLAIEFRGIYSSRHSRGFKISYSFVEDYGITTGKQLLEFPCAFVFNSTDRTRGTMMSPNFPGLYPRDTECNYFFYGNKNERVHLQFTHFDVEGVVPCEALSASDYVQFSNQMIDTRSPRHCGQLKELHVTSEKDFFRVTFKSNDRLDGTGFKADYLFLRDSEMHKITMPNAVDGGTGIAAHTSKFVFWLAFDVILIIHV